jgi:diguanylate cyclase
LHLAPYYGTMSIHAYFLAAVAYISGLFTRESRAPGEMDLGISTGSHVEQEPETQGLGWNGRSIPKPQARQISAFCEALAAGNYLAIAEIHRFSALRRQIGYLMTDQLLAIITNEVQQSLPDCTLGRVSRNSVEFVFSDNSDADAAKRLEELSRSIESNLEIDGCHIGLVMHFGAVRITESTSRLTDFLLDKAELALAEAQRSKHRVVINGSTEWAATDSPSIIAIRDIPRAIAGKELSLAYQPKLHCRSDSIHTVEALLRWQHPVHGLVNTQEMIHVAEDTGMIRDLTKWVIEQAARDQKQLDETDQNVSIDVNISGSLLSNTALAQWALEQLTQSRQPMGIEITETAVIQDPEQAIANLRMFAEAGVRIAIDDYGAGLSSLFYLKQLPAHELKIDRSFISGLIESHRDPLIIRSTIDLAHALDMEVTAEGVDDPMAFGLLRAMGCDIIQGYLISHPLRLDELEAFLRSWRGSEHHSPERRLSLG